MSPGWRRAPTCREAFPAGGAGWKPLREVNKVVLRQLNALKVYCPHHKEAAKEDDSESSAGASAPKSAKRRKVDGGGREAEGGLSEEPEEPEDEHCHWEGDYGELLSKHLGECRLHAVECPRGCGAKVVRKDLVAHAACAKNFNNCEICGDPVQPENAEQPRREKAELHAQILEKRLAEEVAQRRALEKRLEERETDARLARIEEALRGLPWKVEWRFKAADVLAEARANGDRVQSDACSLQGAGNIWLSLYPRGRNRLEDMANKVPISVRGPCEVTGRLSMLSAGMEVGGLVWDTPTDISKGLVICDFVPSVEAFAAYGEVRIVFELTKAVALVGTKRRLE